MSLVNIPQKSRRLVVIEALKCATLLDGLRVIESKDGPECTVRRLARGQAMLGANPKWVVNFRTWGERGVVKEGKGKKSVDRGIPMMFVGYPENWESDSVRMWNPETNGVVTTRDVIWMNKMFFEKPSEDENEDEQMVHLTKAEDETVEVVKSDDESEAGESANIDASSSR